jgi:alkylation response protein AidB-like acyl-CoA dehydrogenase
MAHMYGLSEQGLYFAKDAAKLAAEVLAKHAADVDVKGRFPTESIAALGTRGFMGLTLDPKLGGQGQAPRVFAAVVEELATACASTAMIYVMHVSAAMSIASSKTLEGRDEILKQIAAGKHLSTLALSEKGSRSQFWAPVSKLVPQGDHFVTNAYKSWSTAGSHADSLVSTAQMPGAKSPLESTCYLLRKGQAGLRVAQPFDGLGLRGNDSCALSIENLTVKTGDLVTAQGEGAKLKLEVVLPWFAIGSAAMAAGLSRAAGMGAAQHVSGTGFEHDGTKLRDLPQLRARVAEMMVRTEQARTLIAYTVGEMEAPNEMTPLYVLQSRLAGLEAAVEVTDLAMKTCGGAAFSKHLTIERNFRDARAGWVMAPTVDHLKDFIGKALTGLPLF